MENKENCVDVSILNSKVLDEPHLNNAHGTKDTVVSLRPTKSKKGVYLSRVQVVVFSIAFFSTLIVIVLIMHFLENGSHGKRRKHPSSCLCAEEINSSMIANLNATNLGTTPDYRGPGPWDEIRLPRTVLPIHYVLELHVDLKRYMFIGSVEILVHVHNATKYILFHISHLEINRTTVTVTSTDKNESVEIVDQFYVNRGQFHVIILRTDLEPGANYIITISRFHGYILPDLKGLYLSSYKTKNGQLRNIASSQLQSTDARKVFPCFDEPDMKATFKISITCREEYTSLSNMPVIREKWINGGWIRRDFNTTPIMSTYILAFVVSDFKARTKIIDGNYQLRVWAQPSMINQTEYALEFAAKTYAFFTEYFGIADVVPKADHVAVPDFSAGAMENWGLVLYRETALLYDSVVSSSSNKYMVTLIVAHEIAHTWFGNMATMKWWNDLWLNEGFASILMYFAMDHVYPEWNVFAIQVVEDVFHVMVKDALVTSHPVSTPIEHPDDIAQYFDQISYSKGMAVLRMLLGFVGWDDFRKGLQLYVDRYKFKNAEMDELWQTFTEAVNHTFIIKTIMDTWTRQMGYPVITVISQNGSYLLEQSRFLLDNDSKDESISPFDNKWYIPFTYMTKDNPDQTNVQMAWLDMGPATVPRASDGWIIGNINYTGFFRVNYELEMWKKLADQLNTDHTVFPQANRAGLIGDAFNLARGGLLDYSVALNMTIYLKNEESYVPWRALLDSIEFIRGMMSKTGGYVLMNSYLRDLVAPVYDSVGISMKGTLSERYLRRLILQTGCDVGVSAAIQYAKSQFVRWRKTGESLPADYALVIYSVGVREGNVDEWDYLWNKSETTKVAAEREILLEALAQAQKPWLLWRYMNWIFDASKIRMQDIRLVVSYFAKNPLGRMIAIHFLMDRWDELNDKFGKESFLLREMIGEVTAYVNTDFELYQFETLFRERPPKVAKKEAENALALIRANIKWTKNNYGVIARWLEAHVNSYL